MTHPRQQNLAGEELGNAYIVTITTTLKTENHPDGAVLQTDTARKETRYKVQGHSIREAIDAAWELYGEPPFGCTLTIKVEEK